METRKTSCRSLAKILVTGLAFVTLISCNADRRAARYIEKARIIQPDIVYGVERLIPVELETQPVRATFTLDTNEIVLRSKRIDLESEGIKLSLTRNDSTGKTTFKILAQSPNVLDTVTVTENVIKQPSSRKKGFQIPFWIWLVLLAFLIYRFRKSIFS